MPEPDRPSLADVITALRAILDPVERAREVGRVMTEALALTTELGRIRRDAVAELLAGGLQQTEVAALLGVSTGRISQLKSEVIVERAIPTPPDTRAAASLYLSEAERQGVTARREMLHVGTFPAPPQVATALRVEAGSPVLLRRKRMYADEVPVRIADSFFRHDVADGTPIAGEDFVEGGFQVYFDRVGRKFGRAVESFTARPASADETDLLQLEPAEIVVEVVRCSYDAADIPVHCLVTVCAAGRHIFRVPQPEGDRVF